MKTILNIARFELGLLFYSPVAWFVLVIFMAFSAVAYFDAVNITVLSNEFTPLFKENGFTKNIINNNSFGLFKVILQNLFLLIPLLTMGLVSKELSSGSIKLVLTSPVTSKQLILGKYLAILTYCLLLTLLLTTFIFANGAIVAHSDTGLIVSSLIGFFLLAATYSAIGLFISCFTSYQIIAAIGTMVLLGALSYIGNIGQGTPVLEDITYWLSMSGRATEMTLGLVSSSGVMYFLIIIALFLTFAVYKIDAGRESSSVVKQIMRYAGLFLVATLFAYVSNRPILNFWMDTTAQKVNTYHENTKKILNEIGNSKLTFKTYVNVMDGAAFSTGPKRRKVDIDKFATLQRYLPNMEMEYIFFYDSIHDVHRNFVPKMNPELITLEQQAEKATEVISMDFNSILKPEEIRKIIDLRSEGNRLVRVLEYNGKTSPYLHMMSDSEHYPGEAEIVDAIKGMLEGTVRVTFVKGHNERSYKYEGDENFSIPLDTKPYRGSLVNHGFSFNEVNLNIASIPEETEILVIADPKTPYSPDELNKIKTYLDSGRNAIVLAEHDNKAALEDLGHMLDIEFGNGLLEQNNDGYQENFILASSSDESEIRKKFSKGFAISASKVMTIESVRRGKYKAVPAFEVSAKNTRIQDSTGTRSIGAPIAYTLTRNIRNKEQRILVTGDADMFSNIEVKRSEVGDKKILNASVIGSIYAWLTNGKYPVDVKLKKAEDVEWKLGKGGIGTIKVVMLYTLPGLVLVLAAIVLIRRKRK